MLHSNYQSPTSPSATSTTILRGFKSSQKKNTPATSKSHSQGLRVLILAKPTRNVKRSAQLVMNQLCRDLNHFGHYVEAYSIDPPPSAVVPDLYIDLSVSKFGFSNFNLRYLGNAANTLAYLIAGKIWQHTQNYSTISSTAQQRFYNYAAIGTTPIGIAYPSINDPLFALEQENYTRLIADAIHTWFRQIFLNPSDSPDDRSVRALIAAGEAQRIVNNFKV